MTLSEFLQARRIRARAEGRVGNLPAPLVCGNGTVLTIAAGAEVALCHPRDDAGPWDAFEVAYCAGPFVAPLWPSGEAARVQAGDLVKILELCGWPEVLGRRWKKPRNHVTRP